MIYGPLGLVQSASRLLESKNRVGAMTQSKWQSLIRELKVTGATESSCSGSDVKRLELELVRQGNVLIFVIVFETWPTATPILTRWATGANS